MIRFLLLLVLLLGLAGDGDKDGRRGNAHYKSGNYEAAADAYYRGLAAYETGTPDAAYYGLQNNLGAALHQQGDFALARPAFARAMETAPSQADFARAAYNAGNNAFREEQAEAALDFYKKALLADPANADAKFNYEFVKRRLEQQQQQGQGENQDQQDGENQDENQQGENQQNQDQQNQEQQQEGQNQEPQEGEQPQNAEPQPQPETPDQLSRQQAERILQALENEEQQLLREVQKVKGRPRRVEKDW